MVLICLPRSMERTKSRRQQYGTDGICLGGQEVFGEIVQQKLHLLH
jgi:hypothetical protein